jgi:K+-sensing histidine kinase KdpD
MMKVEFLVYERIQKGDVKLNPNFYKIRDVVMKTLHMFFEDFTKKDVRVVIEENYDLVWLDYESIATALYYLIDNATKYIKPHSVMEVGFYKEAESYKIELSMTSHYLDDEDRKHIFDEGYSGEYAIKEKTNGSGYGMYRVRHLLKQCGAQIDIEYGDSEGLYDETEYAKNSFSVCLPYKGTTS